MRMNCKSSIEDKQKASANTLAMTPASSQSQWRRRLATAEQQPRWHFPDSSDVNAARNAVVRRELWKQRERHVTGCLRTAPLLAWIAPCAWLRRLPHRCKMASARSRNGHAVAARWVRFISIVDAGCNVYAAQTSAQSGGVSAHSLLVRTEPILERLCQYSQKTKTFFENKYWHGRRIKSFLMSTQRNSLSGQESWRGLRRESLALPRDTVLKEQSWAKPKGDLATPWDRLQMLSRKPVWMIAYALL